jgi:hypothetical protein
MIRAPFGIATGSLLAVVIAVSGAYASTTRQSKSACPSSKRAVTALVRRTAPQSIAKLTDQWVVDGGGGVTSWHCVDLTHDGTADVLVNVSAGGSIGGVAWLVYRGPTYRLVHIGRGQPNGGVRHVTANPAGGDVIEHEPRYHPSDPNCCPDGGDLYRLFRWRNGKFHVVESWLE